MHRSRLSVLVILAAGAAACSTHDDTDGTAILSQDRTLVARLAVDQESHPAPLPNACGTIAIPAQPAVSNKLQAEELTRQAQGAEMHGDVAEARSLLRRASELDATNKSAAYHLGRTSEALGDSAAAMTAYCRYLALTPTTAESVEARERVAKLSRSQARTQTASAGASAAVRPQQVATVPATATTRVAVTKMANATPTRAATPAPRRVARAAPITEPRRVATATVSQSARTTPPERETRSESSAGGDLVTASSDAGTASSAPAAEQPAATPQRTVRRGPTMAQRAGIGAGVGAILGAATGRSMKSAVIGAAAGGILGSVVGNGTF
jgi:hypothetical protein